MFTATQDRESIKYLSGETGLIKRLEATFLDSASESSSRSTEWLPSFLDVIKDEPRSRVRLTGMEAHEDAKDCDQDHIGLNQITAFEQVEDTSKREDDGGDSSSHVWTIAEVEALLRFYKEREEDLKDPRRKKKTIWNEICAEMRMLGYVVTPGQCECKMKNMKATYRRTLDRIRAGDAAQRCAFYEELYDIFGHSPHVRTFSTPSQSLTDPSNCRKRNPNINENGKEVEEFLDDEQSGSSLGLKRTRFDIGLAGTGFQDNLSQEYELRKANSEFVEELRMLRKSLEQERQAREEERKKNEEERDRRAREFHEERMAMLNSMNKLIASLGSKD